MKYTASEFIGPRISLAPKSQSGAALHKGTGVDCLGHSEALVELSIGTMAGGSTYDCKVQESDDDVDGNYADITGAAFAQKVAASHASKVFVGRINLGPRKRWLRVVGTDAVGAVLVGANIILMGATRLPITQQQTVGFSV